MVHNVLSVVLMDTLTQHGIIAFHRYKLDSVVKTPVAAQNTDKLKVFGNQFFADCFYFFFEIGSIISKLQPHICLHII